MKGDLRFDWDEANLSHIAVHDVTAEEVEQAMENDPEDLDYDVIAGEERWTSIGNTDLLRVLTYQVDDARWSGRNSYCVGSGPQDADGLFPCEGCSMKKLVIPQFATEKEEADWWYAHKDIVEANISEALRTGKTRTGTAKKLAEEGRTAKNITISLPMVDLERARRLSAKKGLGYQTYVRMLLREALDREQAAAGRNKPSRRNTA